MKNKVEALYPYLKKLPMLVKNQSSNDFNKNKGKRKDGVH